MLRLFSFLLALSVAASVTTASTAFRRQHALNSWGVADLQKLKAQAESQAKQVAETINQAKETLANAANKARETVGQAVTAALTPTEKSLAPGTENCCTDKECDKLNNQHPEYCFGAVGPQCAGVPVLAPAVTTNGEVKLFASVGSIYHDLCCHQHPKGVFCSGSPTYHANAKDSCECQLHWRKAVWNVADGHQWEVKFPADAACDMSVPSAVTRQTRLSDVLGHFGPVSAYGVTENACTAKLKAPKGTKLDCPREDHACKDGAKDVVAGDSLFCASGKFAKVVSSVLKSWGECA